MKKEKWENAHHPPQVWLAKLMEEIGEVAEAYRHWQEGEWNERDHMIDELKHVCFIAECARDDLERGIAS